MPQLLPEEFTLDLPDCLMDINVNYISVVIGEFVSGNPFCALYRQFFGTPM